MEYKGHIIGLDSFGYTVWYRGDEIVFSTEWDAMDFIDELEEDM